MINQKVQQYNAAVYLRLSKEDMDSAQKAESNSIVNQKQLILGFLQDLSLIHISEPTRPY